MHQANGLDIGIDHKWNIKQPCFRVVSIWKTDKKLQHLKPASLKREKDRVFKAGRDPSSIPKCTMNVA